MREYIHFFEDSSQRDAYENGSDYIEPYVSYTPVINGYEAQSNGRTIDDFAVTKQGNSYLISSNSNSTEIINEEEFGEKPIVNSNIFYISRLSTGLDVIRTPRTAYIYVFPEDLELTEESTEFTFNGVTYAIESIGTNTWSVIGRNPDEGLHFSNMYKFDIVSVPSSSNDFVHYNLTDDTYNGHAYVDLGLPSGTLWAKMNVGAQTETDYGLYFAWGETTGYTASQVGTDKNFSWDDYALTEDSGSTFTKYNATDNKTHLELTDDAAAANMGGDWHMPTKEQCIELFKETKNGFVTNAGAFTQYAWDNTNGYSSPTDTTATIDNWNTAGYFFFKNTYTSVTDAITDEDYLFVPAAGYCGGGKVYGVGVRGDVWASALFSEDVENAWSFYFYSGRAGVYYGYSRYYGRSVRGVVGYFLSQIEVAKWNYDNGKESGTDGGYTITLTEPIDSNATNVRLCVTSNMENGRYYERPLTNMFGPNWFAHSPRITCSDLDIKYELNGKTYLINGWEVSCIE